ncbi:hypothetical protein [Williamsia sp.]|uniref:hypothetical protein n=1 Tax=Williamsia sp. TaxID=1872085 RepID=UPI0025E79405|nr:hypothetical protein [Williamsia sp.]
MSDEDSPGTEYSGLDGRPRSTPAGKAEPVSKPAPVEKSEPAEKPEPAETPASPAKPVSADKPAPSTTSSVREKTGSPSRRGWLITAAVLVVVLAVATGVAVFSALGYRDDLRDLQAQNSQAQRAKDVASDYAVKAAEIDHRNFDPWFAALKTGVDDAMVKQFTDTEPVLRQLLGQLQWVSKGTLVGSDIKSQNDGKYVVQVFVDVQVTNVQSPGGVKTTALYPITVDKNKNWAITDISGGVAPLATK